MSIRFDNAADRLHYTAVAPPTTFTITMWLYLSVDTNALATFCRFYDGGVATVGTWGTDGTGTGGPNWFTGGGTVTNATNFVVGEWRKVAFTRTGTTGQALVAASGATEVDSGTVSSTAPAGLTLANRSAADGAEPWNGRIAQVRIWGTVLSQAQIEAEWASATPVITANLFANWPLATATDLTDTANSRVLTVHAGGALTTEADPPNTGSSVTRVRRVRRPGERLPGLQRRFLA